MYSYASPYAPNRLSSARKPTAALFDVLKSEIHLIQYGSVEAWCGHVVDILSTRLFPSGPSNVRGDRLNLSRLLDEYACCHERVARDLRQPLHRMLR